MFHRILTQIADALDKAGVPYMVIGGQAVLIYGEPRLTKDIDITLGFDTDKADDVYKIAKGTGLASVVADPIAFARKNAVLPLTDEKSGVRVDLIFSFMPYERQAIARAARIQVNESEVSFATVEDTIIHKLFAGRPRDIEDVKGILQRNKHIDEPYMMNWLGEFSKVTNRDLRAECEQLLRGTEGKT